MLVRRTYSSLRVHYSLSLGGGADENLALLRERNHLLDDEILQAERAATRERVRKESVGVRMGVLWVGRCV